MKSIMQKNKECYFCKTTRWLENHHVFGASNRRNSERYGLTVYLCHQCHNEPPKGVHHNAETMRKLREDGQRAFERVHGTREEFMYIFGKNYL